MAKGLRHKKSFLVICFVLILVVGAFGVGQLLSLNRPVGEEYKKLAEDLLSNAQLEFESIRDISVREVPLEVVDQQWVADTWGTVSDSELEELLRDENIYKALFLISEDDSLIDAKLDWTTSFRAAKWQGTIYVVEENFDVTETTRATGSFVHELTHIMQEDHSLLTPATFDGSKALSALKEGDATLMADTSKNGGTVPLPADVVKPGSSGNLPDSVNKLNRFVYRYGLEFVKTLYNYDLGSWEDVDGAYLNPPTTTEQIIHPEKYLSQEAALPVDAPEVDPTAEEEFNREKGLAIPTTVEIKMHEGRVYRESVKYSKGTPNNPFKLGELKDKFKTLASCLFSERKIDVIIEAVESLDELDDISELTALLKEK